MNLVRGVGFKLVVDYGYGSTSFVMPQVLSKLGADVLGVNPCTAATSGDALRPAPSTRRTWPAW